jgi:lipopolysaccharide export LptBFGC system permease protein LptF
LLLDRAILREIALRLLMVSAGVMFLIGLGGAIRASSISQGAPLWVPLALVPLIVGQALPYFMPLAVLTSVVLSYGRMAADGEDVAAFAAGARPARILLPAAVAGLALSMITHPLSADLLPDLYRRMRELVARVEVAALENTDPSNSQLHFGGLQLMWNGRDEDGAFLDVLLQISGASGKGNPAGESLKPKPAAKPAAEGAPGALDELRIRADRARMRVAGGTLVFSFQGMRAFSESGAEQGWSVENDGWSSVKIDLVSLSNARAPDLRAKDQASRQLRALIADPATDPETARLALYTLHQRRAMSAAAMPLAVLGAMLGWRLRRGGMLAGFGAAMALLILVFYPTYYLGEGLFDNGGLPPVFAAWLPCLVLLPLIALLARGAARRG